MTGKRCALWHPGILIDGVARCPADAAATEFLVPVRNDRKGRPNGWVKVPLCQGHKEEVDAK